jgi:hypothetical protein
MAVVRNDISDPVFESEIFQYLEDFGFSPQRRGDIIHVSGVGLESGDHSVNLSLNLVEMDGHRILEISSQLEAPGVSFDRAVIVSAQGNLSCLTAKFTPVEQIEKGTHVVRAAMVLYADHLSGQELKAMLYLFINEVDAIDNTLVGMLLK